MLINEFDLECDDFNQPIHKKECEYYWLVNRDKVVGGLVYNIVYILKWARITKQKEEISISPVFKIIF